MWSTSNTFGFGTVSLSLAKRSSVQTCHPLADIQMKWIGRTPWGWWDEWDDTALQTRDSKFKPWRSEAEHATYRSRRSPTILSFTSGWGGNIFVFFKPPRPGNEQPSSSVKGSGANHYPRAAAQQIYKFIDQRILYTGTGESSYWNTGRSWMFRCCPIMRKRAYKASYTIKKVTRFVCMYQLYIVTSRDVWRPWHILFNRDL